MIENNFCEGCKNFDEEDCGEDTEILDCDYFPENDSKLSLINLEN